MPCFNLSLNVGAGALSPGDASDRGSEDDESDSEREQDSDDEGVVLISVFQHEGVIAQHPGSRHASYMLAAETHMADQADKCAFCLLCYFSTATVFCFL